jgi:uncharacterized protein (DUF2062 family)
MQQGRFGRYVDRIREDLRDAFAEDHTPRETAWSFAFGTFVTMLPTFGVGLLLFAAVTYVFDRVNPAALVASVLVYNPVVKWGVYVASFSLGLLLLGPIEGVSTVNVSLDSGRDVTARLLVGNLLLAVLATVAGYLVVHRLAVRYATTGIVETVDRTLTDIADEVLEP